MSNYIRPEIRQVAAASVNFVCEYCVIADKGAYFKFQVEHNISRKHGGSSELENLALSCIVCNRCKSSDIASVSTETAELYGFHLKTLQ